MSLELWGQGSVGSEPAAAVYYMYSHNIHYMYSHNIHYMYSHNIHYMYSHYIHRVVGWEYGPPPIGA